MLLFLFATSGCQGPKVESESNISLDTSASPKTKQPVTTQKDSTKKSHRSKSNTKQTYPKITNQNVVTFLTQYGKQHPDTRLRLTCSFGVIDIRLYTQTPLHRANMVYLTEQGYFNLTQFYRVSKDFVDQAGNSDEWDCQEKRAQIGGYTLPAEFNPNLTHTYGSVAMARRYDQNPHKRSSPFEFYIVLGRSYSPLEITAHEHEFDTHYSPKQKKTYQTIGGTPFLDQQHTVIGEVIHGMDVVKKINTVKVDKSEWPLNEIAITMEIVESTKKT